MFCHSTPIELPLCYPQAVVSTVCKRKTSSREFFFVVRFECVDSRFLRMFNVAHATPGCMSHFTLASVVIHFENVTEHVITIAKPSSFKKRRKWDPYWNEGPWANWNSWYFSMLHRLNCLFTWWYLNTPLGCFPQLLFSVGADLCAALCLYIELG